MNLIKAFDNTRYVKGEKGHKQYDWSENIQEKITEFYFQLVRNSDESLENKFIELLTQINTNPISYY